MTILAKCIDRLPRRRWEHLREHWMNHIPNFPAAGTAPSEAIVEIPEFEPIALQLAQSTKAEAEKAKAIFEETGNYPSPFLATKEEEVSGLRELVFWESVFLLHKARHVLGTAEFQIRDGLQTWALANAYQGAFFAAKATLGFLGVSLPEFHTKSIVVDLFPHPVARADEYSACSFHFLNVQLAHLPIWEIFQRVIAVSTVEMWSRRIVNKLKSIDPKIFARQRNTIHYRNCGWLLDDLHSFAKDNDFGNPTEWSTELNFDKADVSVAIAFSILKLGLALVRDLEKYSSKLSPEIRILTTCVENDRHPLYGELLLS